MTGMGSAAASRTVTGVSYPLSCSWPRGAKRTPSPSGTTGPEPAREDSQEADRRSEGEPEEEERRSPFEDKIETDRDAFTPSTKTTPLNRLIVESSYSFIDNRGAPDTNSFPELLLRYGLFKRFELRLGWNYEAGGGGNVVSGNAGETAEGVDTSSLTREQRMLYGFKASLTEQQSWRPDSILIVMGVTPTGRRQPKT